MGNYYKVLSISPYIILDSISCSILSSIRPQVGPSFEASQKSTSACEEQRGVPKIAVPISNATVDPKSLHKQADAAFA